MPTKTKRSNKKQQNNHYFLMIFSATLLVAVLVFGGFSVYHMFNTEQKDNNTKADNNTAEVYEKTENKAPSSEDESTDVVDIKDMMDEANKKPEVEISDSGLKVPVFDLSVRQNNGMTVISGKVTNFIETGGSCTYTLTGVSTKSYTKGILPDGKYTICDALIFKSGELASGTWTVKVEYKSNTAGGVSETQTFTVQ